MNNEKGQVSVVLIAILLWIVFGLLIGGWLFEYSFEFWASYIKEHAVDLPFWVAMIAGALLGGATVPVAIITFLCSLVL